MILIQCTNSKRSEAAPAKDLYDESNLFVKMRAYAEATGDKWAILSAKHGLVYPDEELTPYDEFGLSEDQATEIAAELASDGIKTVTVIAGKKYTNPLTPALEKRGIDVVELCRGLSIGNRMSKLDSLVAQKQNGCIENY